MRIVYTLHRRFRLNAALVLALGLDVQAQM